MAEPPPQFWFPKISSNAPNPHSLVVVVVVVKAVNQVVELFTSESTSFHQISICDECKNQGILSSSSLKAKPVLEDILSCVVSPFCVSIGNYRLSNPRRTILQCWNMWIFAQTFHRQRVLNIAIDTSSQFKVFWSE